MAKPESIPEADEFLIDEFQEIRRGIGDLLQRAGQLIASNHLPGVVLRRIRSRLNRLLTDLEGLEKELKPERGHRLWKRLKGRV